MMTEQNVSQVTDSTDESETVSAVIDRKKLTSALRTLSPSVGRRINIPALGCVKVTLSDGWLDMEATDLELTTKVRVPAEAGAIIRETFLVPFVLFRDSLKSETGRVVYLDNQPTIGQVKIGRATLRTLPVEDFPTTTEPSSGFCSLSDASILGMVATTASKDETRPVLTGVYMEGSDAGLSLCATDSYRLTSTNLPDVSATPVKILFPARVAKIIGKATGPVDICHGPSQVSFITDAGRTIRISRQIEGEYPNYRQLIPDDADATGTLTIDAAELIAACKSADALRGKTSGTPVMLRLSESTTTPNRLTINVPGSGSLDLPLSGTFIGSDIEIPFDPSKLLDVGAIGSTVIIYFRDPLRPAVIRDTLDGSRLMLVMPIRMS